MSEYSCNSTNEQIISDICTNGSDTSFVECILPYDDTTLKVRYTCGAWMIITAILGIACNELALAKEEIKLPPRTNKKF